MGVGFWNVANLVLAMLFMAGFAFYYVAGVLETNRALSRAAAIAFLVCGVIALVMLVRVVL